MTTSQRFAERCHAYAGQRGITEGYLSKLLFDDGKVVGALRGGADITLRRLERAEVLLGEFERALQMSVASREAA